MPPARPDDDAAWRAERRTVARRLHPDLGGDLDRYLQAVAAVDARHGRGRSAPRRPTVGRTRATASGRARRRLRTATRTVRQRLPRWAPGARRWTQI